MPVDYTFFGDDATFGEDYFGFTYSADNFPGDALEDLNNILLDHGKVYTIIRVTDTVDTMGAISNTTQATFLAHSIVQDITKKDRQIHEMGLAIPGNSKAFFAPTYTDGTSTDIVKEGDILVDENQNRWRIVKMLQEPYTSDQQVYRSAVIQSIGLEGSS